MFQSPAIFLALLIKCYGEGRANQALEEVVPCCRVLQVLEDHQWHCTLVFSSLEAMYISKSKTLNITS